MLAQTTLPSASRTRQAPDISAPFDFIAACSSQICGRPSWQRRQRRLGLRQFGVNRFVRLLEDRYRDLAQQGEDQKAGCEYAGADHRVQDQESGAEKTDIPAQLGALVVGHPIPML